MQKFLENVLEYPLLLEEIRAGGLECGLQLSGRGPDFLEDEGEFDFRIMELLRALTLAEFGRNGGSPDNLDAMAPDSVAGCHLVVHLLHGTIQCSIPVLFVHVVVTCSALVPQPDAIILYLCWFPLKYLPKFSSRFSLYIKEKISCTMKNCFGSVDCLGKLCFRLNGC